MLSKYKESTEVDLWTWSTNLKSYWIDNNQDTKHTLIFFARNGSILSIKILQKKLKRIYHIFSVFHWHDRTWLLAYNPSMRLISSRATCPSNHSIRLLKGNAVCPFSHSDCPDSLLRYNELLVAKSMQLSASICGQLNAYLLRWLI